MLVWLKRRLAIIFIMISSWAVSVLLSSTLVVLTIFADALYLREKLETSLGGLWVDATLQTVLASAFILILMALLLFSIDPIYLKLVDPTFAWLLEKLRFERIDGSHEEDLKEFWQQLNESSSSVTLIKIVVGGSISVAVIISSMPIILILRVAIPYLVSFILITIWTLVKTRNLKLPETNSI